MSGAQGAGRGIREAAGAEAEGGEEQAPRGTETKAQRLYARFKIVEPISAHDDAKVNQLNHRKKCIKRLIKMVHTMCTWFPLLYLDIIQNTRIF